MPPRRKAPPTVSTVAVAVEETITGLGDRIRPEDAAAVALARQYAKRIDGASQLEHELAVVAGVVYDYVDLCREVDKLTRRVGEVTTLAELGPKLTAVLIELGATPKVRGLAPGAKPPATPTQGATPTTPGGVLNGLRADTKLSVVR